MSYFAPYVDESGLHLPTYNDILEKRLSDAKSIYGQDIYLGNDSADYQFIAAECLALYDTMQAIQLAYNQMSPPTAIGVGLSNLVQLNGIQRRPASYSTCDVLLVGTSAVTISNGVITDVSGNKWNLPTPSVTLQAAGSPLGSSFELLVTVTCQTLGAIAALPGDLSTPDPTITPTPAGAKISTPTTGWTATINTSAAAPGIAVETDSELRERQFISVTLPSQTMLSGTIAAIAAIQNVSRYRVYENNTGSSTYGDDGVPFEGSPPHSITAVVEGGEIDEIATAIYNNRGLGCYVGGDDENPLLSSFLIEVDMYDSEGDTHTPIRFYRPDYVPIYVVVEVHTLREWASEEEDDIKIAIETYINTLGIGEVLAASSVMSAAVNTMSNYSKPSFSIRSILIGSSPLVSTEVELAYYEVAQGDRDLVTITLV